MILPLNLSRQTDEQLMARAANDNKRAFEELYNRYARRLQGFFYRQLGQDRELAADYTHDTFLRLYDARRTYRRERSFSTWLFTVAYNLCRNRYRHLQTEAEVLAQLDSQPYDNEDIELQMDRQTLDSALRHVLEGLDAQLQLLFSLRYEEDLTVPQIAEITTVPEGTVKSRLHKLMNMIKKKLKQYENH